MSDLEYKVRVSYTSSGDLGLGKAKTSADNWLAGFKGSIANSLATSFNSAFDSAASTMISTLGAAAAVVGGLLATGMAKAVKESIAFNDHMERTSISVAAMFSAAGQGMKGMNTLRGQEYANADQSSFTIASGLSERMIKQMRKDAVDLPGTFEDLSEIMRSVSLAGSRAGLDAYGTEKLAAEAMTVGKIGGMSAAVAGREIAAILDGNIRHTMPMARLLGLEAKRDNKLSYEDRYKLVRERMHGLSNGAMGAYSNTWDALSSGLKDKVQGALGAVGNPLFNHLKDEIVSFNTKMAKEGTPDWLIDLGVKIGGALVTAFDKAKAFILEWYQPAYQFARNIYYGLADSFRRAGSILEHVFGNFKHFLNDPGTFGKLEHIVKTLVAMRVGSGAFSSVGTMAGGAFKLLESAGVGVEALSVAAIPAAAAIAAIGVAAYGLTSAFMNTSSIFHQKVANQIQEIEYHAAGLGNQLSKLGENLTPVAELMGVGLIYAINEVVRTLEALAWAANAVIAAFKSLDLTGSSKVADYNRKVGEGMAEDMNDISKSIADNIDKEMSLSIASHSMPTMDTTGSDKPTGIDKVPKVTQNIKVEIKVEGNEDPRRFAINVQEELKKLSTLPTSTDAPGSRAFMGRTNDLGF